MNALAQIIAKETKNCSFSLLQIQEFLSLMESQQKQFSDFGYQSNGSSTLVLKARKNGGHHVALKVIECKNLSQGIGITQRGEYADVLNDLPCSKYFVQIHDQFYLTEYNDCFNYSKNEDNTNQTEKRYFVQEIDLCQCNLREFLQQFKQDTSLSNVQNFKEILAIQMLDAVNLLHLRQVAHGNITAQSFLVSQSEDCLPILKLQHNCQEFPNNNFGNSENPNEPLSQAIQKSIFKEESIDSDLFSLGIILLELDNAGSCYFNSSSVKNLEITQLQGKGKIFESNDLNRTSLLYKIAREFLSKSPMRKEDVRSILLFLLQQSQEYTKIPLFSIVMKSSIEYLSLDIPQTLQARQQQQQQSLMKVVNKSSKIKQSMRYFAADNTKPVKLLSNELLRNALQIMLSWEDFSEQYDILSISLTGSVFFGVENLKEKRPSIIQLSLCTNKSETLREISIMKISQSPYIQQLYQHKFFSDIDGNEFVAYELEKPKYSLIHHLELQRIQGKYSDESKYLLLLQIIYSVKYLHYNSILHRNITLSNFGFFQIEGQLILKLSNFSHAGQLQDYFISNPYFKNQVIENQYFSSENCIIQKYNQESTLYFAPERWQYPFPTTFQTDIYSVGVCLVLLDSYLELPQEALLEPLTTFPQFCKKYEDNPTFSINKTTKIYEISNQLLKYLPEQRQTLQTLQNCILFTNYFTSYEISALKQIKNNQSQENQQQQQFHLALIKPREIVCLQSSQILPPQTNFVLLSSLSLNMDYNFIRHDDDDDDESQYLLSNLKNLVNLLSLSFRPSFFKRLLSLSFKDNSIRDKTAMNLLSPISNLTNLQNIVLNLEKNQISEIGAQSLLIPCARLTNLSTLFINLNENMINSFFDTQSLFFPLRELLNLTSVQVILQQNQIKAAGAQSLLLPLTNLVNLQSISLKLFNNQIENVGTKNLLIPLSNLLQLSILSLQLENNFIGEIGAKHLLSPLKNLINLSHLSLNLWGNSINDSGAESLLSPLSSLINLSSLFLDLFSNSITEKGAESLLLPLKNLLNLQNVSLNLQNNPIGNQGAQCLLSPLSNNPKLSSIELNLSNTSISDEGAQSLLIPLMGLRYLTVLSLTFFSDNISDTGAYSIIYPLMSIVNLYDLSLTMESYPQDKEISHIFNKSLQNVKNVNFSIVGFSQRRGLMF